MKTKNILRILALTLVVTALGLGCKASLEQGGAYNPAHTNADGTVSYRPDKALFTADSLFWAAYSTLDAVFTIERNNREALWKLSPEIKHTLDKIRVQALAVATGYSKARTTYIANPGPTTLSSVNDWIAKLQSLAAAATSAIPTGTTTNLLANP